MTALVEVDRLHKRLDDTFKRAAALTQDLELQADFARYLCILVAGFLEQSLIEVVLELARRNSAPSIQRHVEAHIRRFTNPKCQRIIDMFATLDPAWAKDLEEFLVDERRAAVDSVVDLRHTFSHGRYSGITLGRVKSYYESAKSVIDHIVDMCI